MSERLPIPADLEHLIEKREIEADRRRGEQREQEDRRGEDDLGPLGAIETTQDLRDLPTDERREEEPRRQASDRRRRRRRKTDE
jgi:hypothetical protein